MAGASALGLSAGAAAAFANPLAVSANAIARREPRLASRAAWPAGAHAATVSDDVPVPLHAFPDSATARISHLLRRAGFGETAAVRDRFARLGVEGAVDHLLDYERIDDSALDKRLASLAFDTAKPRDLMRWWLVRMVHTQRPFLEKIVLFWHGLLTSGFQKVGQGPQMFNQNQLFRNHAVDRYGVLLKAVSRDPAMLSWLDSRSNRKSAPNENFARELMELFTMGPGNYTERDVRESARAFTGWGLREKSFFFRAGQHDYGVKQFLGRSGRFDGDGIIDIVLEQPAASWYIARRLFEFFAYDGPSDETIAPFATTLRESGFSIKATVRRILTSDEFFSGRAYRAKIKGPAELVAGAFRTLGLETDGRGLDGLIGAMGQTLFLPPDVAGWAGGSSWINSTTLLHRVNFAHHLSSAVRRQLQQQLPRARVEAYRADRQARIEGMIALLLDGELAPDQRRVLDEFIQQAEGGTKRHGVRQEADLLSNVDYLILASPDYQLA